MTRPRPSSPTAADLERMTQAEFEAAIDQLEADTVPYTYWAKVVGRNGNTSTIRPVP